MRQHKSNQASPPISNPEREVWEKKQRENSAYTGGWNSWIKSITSINPFEEGIEEYELWASGYKDASTMYGPMRSIGMNYSSNGEQGEQNSRVIGVPKKRGRPKKQQPNGQFTAHIAIDAVQAQVVNVPKRFSFQSA
jgi:hypothetical protein